MAWDLGENLLLRRLRHHRGPLWATLAPMGTYLVRGVSSSYFTRKVTGYLDYSRRRWQLDPFLANDPEAAALGWNGGIPIVVDPDGVMMWDSTSIINHLDRALPEHSVRPVDPGLGFLCDLLDDFSDEWFYRHAVGSRWLYEENRVAGSLDLAREAALAVPLGMDVFREFITSAMTSSLPKLGTSEENIEAWIHDSLLPWQRVFGAHLAEHGFLFGRRPSLADFAFYGGNAAHFAHDPLCLRWTEAASRAVVDHTAILTTPAKHEFGAWFSGLGDVPDTLIAVLAEAGRHYLPWVAEATVTGQAVVTFSNGSEAEIPSTPFLDAARGVLLARYVEARTETLDAVLEQAGILRWFAEFTDQATHVPDPSLPPQPTDNRPYPSGP